jgi:hypothetical protein
LNEEGDALDRAYLGLDTLIENAEAIDASGAIYSTIRRSHHSIFEKTERVLGHVVCLLMRNRLRE